MYASFRHIWPLLSLLLLPVLALLPACAPAQVIRETVVVVVTPTDSAGATTESTSASETAASTLVATAANTTAAATAVIPTLQFATSTPTRMIVPPTLTRPAPSAPTLTPPVVKIALFEGGVNISQTAPNTTDRSVTTALVFQVDVSLDTSKVKDKLSHVEMRVVDPRNQTVYQHTENNEPYCMFADTDQKCNTWVFADHGNAWPNNRPVQRGSYFLRALAVTAGGQTRADEAAIYIDPRPNGQDSPIQVQIVQTGPGNNDDRVDKALVFQAEAFDQRKGNADGQGIDHVDLEVVDQLGNIVYQRTEKTAKYCAFGGGEPDCTIWDFAAHGNRWPTNTPIYNNAQYFLRAIAYAPDGTSGAAVTSVIVQH